MLQKLITKIKQSLPEALQKKLKMEITPSTESDDEDDFNEATSTEYRYEGFDEDEIADLEDDEQQEKEFHSSNKITLKRPNKDPSIDKALNQKKRISMLIRVVVILVIAYLVLDEVYLKDLQNNEVSVDTQSQELSFEEQTQASIGLSEQEKIAEPFGESETNFENENENEDQSINDQLPIEDVNITRAETQEDENTQAVFDEDIANDISNSIDEIEETIVENSPVTTQTEAPMTDFSPDEQSTQYSDLNSSLGNFDYARDLIDSRPTEEIDSKIIDTPVKTAPPDYENAGRGLVYNCTDKHWACIDKPGYIQCNKNSQWNKSIGVKPNCFVKAIYTEVDDCVKVQAFYVSNSEATPECN